MIQDLAGHRGDAPILCVDSRSKAIVHVSSFALLHTASDPCAVMVRAQTPASRFQMVANVAVKQNALAVGSTARMPVQTSAK